MRTRDDRYNDAGYPDPTEWAVEHKEMMELRRIKHLVSTLKAEIENAGFELVERVILKDKATGKVYR